MSGEEQILAEQFSFPTSRDKAPKTYTRKNKKPPPGFLPSTKLEPGAAAAGTALKLEQQQPPPPVKIKQEFDESLVLKQEPI